MSESVAAALAIEAQTLRFAEAERVDGTWRLRGTGQHAVGDRVSDILLGEETEKQRLGPAVEGMQALLDDTAARTLRLVVHPSSAYSFFTPISANASVQARRHQLLRQASLVTGVRSVDDLHLTSTTVRTAQDQNGESYMWVHVLALPAAAQARMEAIREVLPVEAHEWTVSMEAAARVTGHVERKGVSAQQALRPYTLAVGRYASHTEYALSRNREWYHALHAADGRSASNQAYYAVGLLNRIDVSPETVGRLFVYGTHEDMPSAPFRDLFECEPEALDPSSLVASEAAVTPPGAYVPCIGAVIDDFVG